MRREKIIVLAVLVVGLALLVLQFVRPPANLQLDYAPDGAKAVLDGVTVVHNGKFRLKPGQWQATKPDDRSDLQRKIALCRALAGKRAGEVQALLGPPTGTRSSAIEVLSYRFGPDDVRYMEVRLRGGRVVEVGRVTTSGPLPA